VRSSARSPFFCRLRAATDCLRADSDQSLGPKAWLQKLTHSFGQLGLGVPHNLATSGKELGAEKARGSSLGLEFRRVLAE